MILISIVTEPCKIIFLLILGSSSSFSNTAITVTVRGTVYVGCNQSTKSTQMILYTTLDQDHFPSSHPVFIVLKGYSHCIFFSLSSVYCKNSLNIQGVIIKMNLAQIL